MPLILWIAAGGAIGAGARHLVNVGSLRLFGPDFPWGTMIVNIAGCFVMGALVALMALKWSVSLEMRAFLTTGILGGFTTFSAFSMDFANLFERRDYLAAGLYGAGSVVLSIAAVFAGLALVRNLA
ncbi:MAG: fluoride efflux transporter CrcB [Parvibaculaceae bacterium]